MSTTLPVTFRASPLPVDFRGTPQAFMDAMVARLFIQSDTSFSLFTIGGTAPTSNTGPWLKDGITWYVWSSSLGQYVPEVIEFQSLRYVASASAPNQALYTFWIELNGSGKAIAIKYFSGGSWKDIYEDKFATYSTTTQMNAAIAAAVAGVDKNQYPFRAYKSASAQTYTAGSGDAQIVYDVENFDPSSVYNIVTSRFVAPSAGYYWLHASAYLTNTSGTPTVLDRQIKLRINGNEVANWQFQVNDDLDGVMLAVTDTRQLALGDYVDAAIYVTSTGASDWSILNDVTTSFFTGHKLLT